MRVACIHRRVPRTTRRVHGDGLLDERQRLGRLSGQNRQKGALREQKTAAGSRRIAWRSPIPRRGATNSRRCKGRGGSPSRSPPPLHPIAPGSSEHSRGSPSSSGAVPFRCTAMLVACPFAGPCVAIEMRVVVDSSLKAQMRPISAGTRLGSGEGPPRTVFALPVPARTCEALLCSAREPAAHNPSPSRCRRLPITRRISTLAANAPGDSPPLEAAHLVARGVRIFEGNRFAQILHSSRRSGAADWSALRLGPAAHRLPQHIGR